MPKEEKQMKVKKLNYKECYQRRLDFSTGLQKKRKKMNYQVYWISVFSVHGERMVIFFYDYDIYKIVTYPHI